MGARARGPEQEVHATGPQVREQRLTKTWQRVQALGNAINDDSPSEALHDLRKRCKELRYLLELFASLYDPKAHKELVKELKLLQGNLGEFQDAESQRFTVHDHAVELGNAGAPTATGMTMGRLEQFLEDRQDDARREFHERWARFHRKHNQRLLALA